MMKPAMNANSTAKKLAMSEVRMPYIMRDNMSRPRSSVPNQYFPENDACRLSRSCSMGSCGAMTDANAATSSMNTMNPRAIMAERRWR